MSMIERENSFYLSTQLDSLCDYDVFQETRIQKIKKEIIKIGNETKKLKILLN